MSDGRFHPLITAKQEPISRQVVKGKSEQGTQRTTLDDLIGNWVKSWLDEWVE